MKNLIYIVFFILSFSYSSIGQNTFSWIEGEVTFVTGKYVYVKFDKNIEIEINDSLYLSPQKLNKASLVISKKSSISILCKPIDGIKFHKGQLVYYKHKNDIPITESISKNSSIDKGEKVSDLNITKDSISQKIKQQKISGRATVGTFSNLPEYSSSTGNHRMRYILNFKGENIKQSDLYFDSYLSYNQTYESNFKLIDKPNDRFKLYRFLIGYSSKSVDVSIGRQIKNKISALGSFDGLFIQKSFKSNLFSGVILGTRPDYNNYGFNKNLFQYGAFLSYYPYYNISSTRGTIAFFEQRNQGVIDRRFIYFQFATTFSKYIRLFTASEIDLYQIINEKATSKPKLTNVYGNLSIKFSRKLNVNIGIDSRKNRIYYETYKDFLETLIERETRQGLRFRARYSPFRKISISAMSNFRYEGKKINSSYYNTTINYRRIPILKMSSSISVSLVNTDFITSKSIYLRLSKKIYKRVNGRFTYKFYQYNYHSNSIVKNQNRIGFNIDISLKNKIYFNIYFEKTLQKDRNYSRLNLRLSKRF